MKTRTQRELQSSSENLNGKGPAEVLVNCTEALLLLDGPAALQTGPSRLSGVRIQLGPEGRGREGRAQGLESGSNCSLASRTEADFIFSN